MNKYCFITVFSRRRGVVVAVAEHVAVRGGNRGGIAGPSVGVRARRFVGVLCMSWLSTTLALAQVRGADLPQGAQLVLGQAQVNVSGAQMQITQDSTRAAINWQSFDIGRNARVQVVQPGADAVLLNRVVGADPSRILGQLQANGQVVLVNPNGILFGSDGRVNTSAFTASTLGISDEDFAKGRMRFSRKGQHR